MNTQRSSLKAFFVRFKKMYTSLYHGADKVCCKRLWVKAYCKGLITEEVCSSSWILSETLKNTVYQSCQCSINFPPDEENPRPSQVWPNQRQPSRLPTSFLTSCTLSPHFLENRLWAFTFYTDRHRRVPSSSRSATYCSRTSQYQRLWGRQMWK